VSRRSSAQHRAVTSGRERLGRFRQMGFDHVDVEQHALIADV
jgi:hypothetical protein